MLLAFSVIQSQPEECKHQCLQCENNGKKVKVTKGKYDSFCSDFNCYLCAGVSFLNLGTKAPFSVILLHERPVSFMREEDNFVLT